ncbi:MAG TPA: DUF1588 domain-containing protein [Polyangia bacterium]|nr:DUF1588 domain-containing protein [Polyangia bacterium]
MNRLLLVALLLGGCGSRTSLGRDGSFVDDDPFLKIDAAPAPPRSSDGGSGSAVPDGSGGPDLAGASTAGAERAVRDIAKLLWQSDPDPRHLALAQGGQIRSSADLESVAREMLQDPRARVGVGAFFRWWLHLDELGQARKDPQLFPLFPKVVEPLVQDVVDFGVGVTLQDGRFATLMTASRPYQDMAVAALVGDRGDDPRRPGLLGRPGLLALLAGPDRPSPVKRGYFIRHDVMCEEIPPSPPNVDTRVPPQPAGLTNREHYASLMTAPACAGCHSMFDPIGYGLEGFDAVGALRFLDHGRMIDSSGTIPSAPIGDLTFNGAAELGKQLSGYLRAQQCVVLKWYQFLRGMPPPKGGDPIVSSGLTAYSRAGDVRDAIVAMLGATPF